MSFDLMLRVVEWRRRGYVSDAEGWLLMELATRAARDGGRIFPGDAELRRCLQWSQRHLLRVRQRLINDGLLVMRRAAGRSSYRIEISTGARRKPVEKLWNDEGTSGQICPFDRTFLSREPEVTADEHAAFGPRSDQRSDHLREEKDGAAAPTLPFPEPLFDDDSDTIPDVLARVQLRMMRMSGWRPGLRYFG